MHERSVVIAGVAAALIAALLIVAYFIRWLRLRETKRRMGECLVRYFNGDLPLDRLYLPERKPGPILEALCWSHARRKFFELADIAANTRRGENAPPISPIALEAVKRIDALFAVEREINGLSAATRLAVRQEKSDRGKSCGRARAWSFSLPWSPRSRAGCALSAPNSPATPP